MVLPGERARSAASLKAAFSFAGLSAQILPIEEALAEARRRALEEGTYVCVTGSLVLIGDVLARLTREGVS